MPLKLAQCFKMWVNGDLLHVGSENVMKCFTTSIKFPLNEWLHLLIKLA